MTTEIRSCRDAEELQRYGDIVAYVFAENRRDAVGAELEATESGWTTCAFVDGTMTTTMAAIPVGRSAERKSGAHGLGHGCGHVADSPAPGSRTKGNVRGLREMARRGT